MLLPGSLAVKSQLMILALVLGQTPDPSTGEPLQGLYLLQAENKTSYIARFGGKNEPKQKLKDIDGGGSSRPTDQGGGKKIGYGDYRYLQAFNTPAIGAGLKTGPDVGKNASAVLAATTIRASEGTTTTTRTTAAPSDGAARNLSGAPAEASGRKVDAETEITMADSSSVVVMVNGSDNQTGSPVGDKTFANLTDVGKALNNETKTENPSLNASDANKTSSNENTGGNVSSIGTRNSNGTNIETTTIAAGSDVNKTLGNGNATKAADPLKKRGYGSDYQMNSDSENGKKESENDNKENDNDGKNRGSDDHEKSIDNNAGKSSSDDKQKSADDAKDKSSSDYTGKSASDDHSRNGGDDKGKNDSDTGKKDSDREDKKNDSDGKKKSDKDDKNSKSDNDDKKESDTDTKKSDSDDKKKSNSDEHEQSRNDEKGKIDSSDKPAEAKTDAAETKPESSSGSDYSDDGAHDSSATSSTTQPPNSEHSSSGHDDKKGAKVGAATVEDPEAESVRKMEKSPEEATENPGSTLDPHVIRTLPHSVNPRGRRH
jgi:hypothetical protein